MPLVMGDSPTPSPVSASPLLLSSDGLWWWDGHSWQPTTPPPPSPVPTFAYSPDGRWLWNGYAWQATAPPPAPVQRHSALILLGAALVILGSLFPWVAVSDSTGLSSSISGISTTGRYVDFLAIVSIVLALFVLRTRPSPALATVLLTLAFLQVALILGSTFSLASTISSLPAGSVNSASLEPGLFCSSLGAGLILLGSLLAYAGRLRPSAPVPAPAPLTFA